MRTFFSVTTAIGICGGLVISPLMYICEGTGTSKMPLLLTLFTAIGWICVADKSVSTITSRDKLFMLCYMIVSGLVPVFWPVSTWAWITVVSYHFCLGLLMLGDYMLNDVRKPITTEEFEKLCELNFTRYMDELMAYIHVSLFRDQGSSKNPDERFMRPIEENLGVVAEQAVDDFRRGIATEVGRLALKGQKFTYKSNVLLQQAIEKYVRERLI